MITASRLAPSSENSGNYRSATAMAPNGGGVLPSGMGSNPASSGANTEPVGAYDDGGMIPDDQAQVPAQSAEQDGQEQQGAASATVDPMSVVKGALAFGRKSMGLPQSFFGGQQQEQGFDEGGEVGEQPDQGMIPAQGDQAAAGGQPQTPDPHKAVQYLTGAGALAPEQVAALDQQVDPQGQMEGSERKMKALSSAGSPQAQFGYLQAMRQKFNAFGAGARAAAKGGNGRPANPAEAAAAANQAFENLPTGQHIAFAPAKGGFAMMARPHAAQGPQQAMEDGGAVSRLPDDQDSENIEDRRDEHGEGYVSKSAGADPSGQGVLDVPETKSSKNPADEGVIRKKTLAFDDGGEVPETDGDDSADAGVIPSDTAAVTGEAPTDQAEPAQTAQPTILTPEQFDKVVNPETFEKATEKGWMDTLKDIMSAVNPMGSAQAGPLKSGGNVINGQNQGTTPPDRVQPLNGPAGGGAPAPEGGMSTAPKKQDRLDQGQRPQPQAQVDPRARDAALMDRLSQQATKLFPWASQQDQRANYIQRMMEKASDQQGRMDLQDHSGKSQVEQLRQAGIQQRQTQSQGAQLEREKFKQGAIDARSQAGREAKTAQVQQLIASRDRAGLLNFVHKEHGTMMNANPKMTAQQFISEMGRLYEMDPKVAAASLQQIQTQGGQQQGPPQQGAAQPGARPQGANMDAATEGARKPYTKNGVTREYEFGKDGMWHLVPDEQKTPAPSSQKFLGSSGAQNLLR